MSVALLSAFLVVTLLGVYSIQRPRDEFFVSSDFADTDEITKVRRPAISSFVVDASGEAELLYVYYVNAKNNASGETGTSFVLMSLDDWLQGVRSFEPFFLVNASDVKVPHKSQFTAGESRLAVFYEDPDDQITIKYLNVDFKNKVIVVDDAVQTTNSTIGEGDMGFDVVEYGDDYILNMYDSTSYKTETYHIQYQSVPQILGPSGDIPGGSTFRGFVTINANCFALAVGVGRTRVRLVFYNSTHEVFTQNIYEDGISLRGFIELAYNANSNSIFFQVRNLTTYVSAEFDLAMPCGPVVITNNYTFTPAEIGTAISLSMASSDFMELYYEGSNMVALYPSTRDNSTRVLISNTSINLRPYALEVLIDSSNCLFVVLVASTTDDYIAFITNNDCTIPIPTIAPLAPTLAPVSSILVCSTFDCLQCNTTGDCDVQSDVLVPSNTTVIILSPTTIAGDITNNGTIIVSLNEQTTIAVLGCFDNSQGYIIVNATGVEPSKDKGFLAIESTCFEIKGNVSVITNDTCLSTSHELKTNSLFVFVSPDGCLNKWLIIGVSVSVGVVVLAVVIFLLAAFFFPPLRHTVLPWSLRKAKMRDVQEQNVY